MAVAINTKRPVRGVTAVAERPGGTRVIFRPYPTPIFDMDGTFAGAVNLLEDVTNEVRAEDFRAQARRCRRLADAVADDIASATLNRMAEEYDGKAAELLAEKRSTISGDVNGHVPRRHRERVVEAQILLVAALVFGAWWTSFGKLRWLLKPYLNDWQVRACRASTRS